MKSNFSVNKEFLLKTAKEILEFNSPTGFCFEIMDKIEAIIKPFGYNFERNNKGGILMEGIVWIIALIGGVYVFGMSTSPSGEIEKISDEKNIYGISEDLINILKQKKIFT